MSQYYFSLPYIGQGVFLWLWHQREEDTIESHGKGTNYG